MQSTETSAETSTNGIGQIIDSGVQNILIIDDAKTSSDNIIDVTVTIQPPNIPEGGMSIDAVFVIDVSGSMSASADIEDAESTGLSVLDLTKHSTKTCIMGLGDNDRISLVKFSNEAQIILPLTYMTPAGKASACSALNTMQPDSATNLWAGLHLGLETLRQNKRDNTNSSLYLLTDGVPNREPPQGSVKMLAKYKDQYDNFNFTANMYGFGYSLDSQLLSELAAEAGGEYAFIPDAGMCGTIFVHAIAVTRTMITSKMNIMLQPINNAVIINDSILGNKYSKESWGAFVNAGSLHFGQSRTIICKMNIQDFALSYLTAHVNINGSTLKSTKIFTGENITFVKNNFYRLHTCEILAKALNHGIIGELTESQNLIRDLLAELRAIESTYSSEFISALINNIFCCFIQIKIILFN